MNTSEKDQLELNVLKTQLLHLEAKLCLSLHYRRVALCELCHKVTDVSLTTTNDTDTLRKLSIKGSRQLNDAVERVNKTTKDCYDLLCNIRDLKAQIEHLEKNGRTP